MIKFFINIRYFLVCTFFLFSFSVFSYEKVSNNSFTLNLKGCVQFDYLFWHGNKHDEFIYGGYLRSADLYANGSFLFDSATYFIHFNITDYLFEDIFCQAYFKYTYKHFDIKIGQFLLPFGLEQANNVYDKMFLETSLLNGMGDGKFLGINIDFFSNSFCFFSSFALPDINYSFKKNYNFKYILAFRTFASFFKTNNFVLHFGLDYKRIKEDQKGDSPFRLISYRDNSCLKTHSSLLNAYNGVIVTSDLVDLEFAFMWKSLFFQTELGFVDVGWRDFDKEIYSSFYFQFSYFLNGIHHKYDSRYGTFCNPILPQHSGAVEFLFKYCIIDMINYGPLLMGYCQTDGRKESLLFGINWIITEQLKLQLNFTVDEFMYCKSPGFQAAGIGFRFQFVY